MTLTFEELSDGNIVMFININERPFHGILVTILLKNVLPFFICLSVDGIWFHVVSGLFFIYVYNPSTAINCGCIQDHYWVAVL